MGATLSAFFFSLFGGRGALPTSAERGGAGGAEAATPAAPAVEITDVVLPKEQQPAQVVPKMTAKEAEAKMTDQCGLDAEYKKWKQYEPHAPIRKSELTEAEKARAHEILKRIFFDQDTLEGKRVPFTPTDVTWVSLNVIKYLKSEPMLITDVPFGVTVVGDLHGQLHDLYNVFAAEEKDGKPGWENMKFLFLGDYVDRGRQALEIVMGLFSLKMLYPDRIFLLRGNHEFILTNKRYGFPVELWDRYEEETSFTLYYIINGAFCYLSVAAIVGNKYFCAHGGISLSGMTRRHWKGIVKPYKESQDDIVVHDTIWSDPASGLHGSAFNAERNTSHYYGLDVLAVALHSMECSLLIRAHSMLDTGYDIIGNLCISIFTATGMSANKNNAVVCVINEKGKVKMRIFHADLARCAWERKLKKMDALNDDDDSSDGGEDPPDEVTVHGDEPSSGAIKAMGPTA